MSGWDNIFTMGGKVFLEPHSDMERLAKLFKKNNVQTSLDLGCGTGRHLIFFANNNFDIYGLDGSPRGIEIAEEWLSEEGIRVETECCKIEQSFPYEDDFFDAIISIQVIHHNLKENILKTVREIERVLRNGGYIFITFPYLKKNSQNDNWNLKKVEEGTYIPQKGKEKGVLHHFSSLEEIQEVFKSFVLLENFIDNTNHRAILGVRK